MYYKPIDIAKKLHISTSALRHYESWGIIPAPKRAKNGYRLYEEKHLAYFRCIRVMNSGFGMNLTSNVMKHVQQGEVDEAFWLVNEAQAALNHEKTLADKTMTLLQNPMLNQIDERRVKDEMTIGEVSKLTDVAASAIRHWEREGLIRPNRNKDNGYRTFNSTHVRQILLIRTLRSTVFYLENMKEVIGAIEHQSVGKAKQVMQDSLSSIHWLNREQFHGVHELYNLCTILNLLEE